MNDERRTVSYRCVAGHPIAANQLDGLTAVWTLDAGARVRVCAEHGAPIAVRVEAAPSERAETA